jgi:Protein of unknown function (DUF3108)
MTRASRTLAFAAAASVLLHVAALGGLPTLGHDAAAPAPPPPLQAHLAPPRPAPAPVAALPKPAPPKAPVRAERKRAPDAASLNAKRVSPRVAAVEQPVAREPSEVEVAHGAAADPSSTEGKGTEFIAAAEDAPASSDAAGPEAAGAPADFGAPAPYPIRRLKAVYDLYYSNASPESPVGRVTHTWSSDGEQYVVESVAEGVGLVGLFYSGKFAQRSEGRIGADGLVPELYTLRRGRAEVSDAARFDWSAATVSLETKGQTQIVPLPRGAQDPLSAQHQFYFVQPLAASGQFRVADGRKLRAFWYEIVGEELLETALGVVSTLHMRRADSENATADVWVDPHRSYLPVKIHVTDRKGRVVAQQIRSLEVEPFATAAVN